MADTDPFASDPIVQQLEGKIWAFLDVKARYPVLVEAAKEIDALRERADLRERHGNSLAIQLLRDSYDMLVIDMYSIRQALAKPGGFFDLLKGLPSRLHVRPSIRYPDGLSERITEGLREAQSWLVGSAAEATADSIEVLISRFIKDTEPLDEDRNRVRAHRYERRGQENAKVLLIPDLGSQIDTMWNYMHKLYLVLTNRDYSKDFHKGDAVSTAIDLADIAVFGSINHAVNYYRVKVAADNPQPWYWWARKDTLARRGT